MVEHVLKERPNHARCHNDEGWSPLMLACKKGSVEVAQTLLRSKKIADDMTVKGPEGSALRIVENHMKEKDLYSGDAFILMFSLFLGRVLHGKEPIKRQIDFLSREEFEVRQWLKKYKKRAQEKENQPSLTSFLAYEEDAKLDKKKKTLNDRRSKQRACLDNHKEAIQRDPLLFMQFLHTIRLGNVTYMVEWMKEHCCPTKYAQIFDPENESVAKNAFLSDPKEAEELLNPRVALLLNEECEKQFWKLKQEFEQLTYQRALIDQVNQNTMMMQKLLLLEEDRRKDRERIKHLEKGLKLLKAPDDSKRPDEQLVPIKATSRSRGRRKI